MLFLGYDPITFLANQFAEFFIFDLFNLIILMPGIHCYIVLVFSFFIALYHKLIESLKTCCPFFIFMFCDFSNPRITEYANVEKTKKRRLSGTN